jgi:deoxyribodipyrimidine photo-lyase
LAGPVADYDEGRNLVAVQGTSGLSQNLAWGEIGARAVWHAAMRPFHEGRGGETFLKELIWREFAYHLLHHTPHIATQNWRADWGDFPWRPDNAEAERWRRGMTGEPFVDAAMRELYVTGTMHNRGRMIVASYLTKHLLTDWRIGLNWFAETLVDWDPAANAMGWQWAAGSGPDASPYFRIFNPATQAEKFDPKSEYRRRFIAELSRNPGPEARAYFDAVPKSWGLEPNAGYPSPIIGLAEGRNRALDAYSARNL